MDEETRLFTYRLEQVKQLLQNAYETEDRALQLASFSAASVLIQWMENTDARYDINYDSTRARKLSEIRSHFARMLGLDPMQELTGEGHFKKAMEAIDEMMTHCVA